MSVADRQLTTESSYTLEPSPTHSGAGRVARRLRRLAGWTVLLTLLGGTAWGLASYSGLLAPQAATAQLTHTVKRGDLVITVTEDGNVESASNLEIRCQVAGGATIKSIVADGTIVKQGDQLIELDSAAIDEQILTQQIAYEKARAVRDQAQNDLAAAKIALKEYVEGTFKKDQQAVDSQVTVAEENLRSAKNTLQFTERMFRKAYVTPLQLEAQQFAVKRAELDLETAKTAKKVLEEFTFVKMKNDLETQVATAEAKAKSEDAAFQLEESKLNRLKTQKVNCIITAPQDGMVVYANESSGRFSSSDRPKVEEGASVRESQVILRLPDLSQMQVKVTVHESKVESLRVGMPASVRIQNRKLTGYVTSVANQPEPTSFFSANVKEYATLVRIDGQQQDLKPGMTAEVEILVDERKNVLTAPVQCVVEQAGKFYVWKVAGGAGVKTEVQLAPGDNNSVEIREGLAEGDVLLQNPPEKTEGAFGASDARRQFGSGPRNGQGAGGAEKRPGAPTPAGEPNAAGPKNGTSQDAAEAGSNRNGGGRPDLFAADKDGDGRISRDEAPERMKANFDRFDGDRDGFVTREEATAAFQQFRASGGGPPAPGGGGAPGGR